jgi:hypothetical protein
MNAPLTNLAVLAGVAGFALAVPSVDAILTRAMDTRVAGTLVNVCKDGVEDRKSNPGWLNTA